MINVVYDIKPVDKISLKILDEKVMYQKVNAKYDWKKDEAFCKTDLHVYECLVFGVFCGIVLKFITSLIIIILY